MLLCNLALPDIDILPLSSVLQYRLETCVTGRISVISLVNFLEQNWKEWLRDISYPQSLSLAIVLTRNTKWTPCEDDLDDMVVLVGFKENRDSPIPSVEVKQYADLLQLKTWVENPSNKMAQVMQREPQFIRFYVASGFHISQSIPLFPL